MISKLWTWSNFEVCGRDFGRVWASLDDIEASEMVDFNEAGGGNDCPFLKTDLWHRSDMAPGQPKDGGDTDCNFNSIKTTQ